MKSLKSMALLMAFAFIATLCIHSNAMAQELCEDFESFTPGLAPPGWCLYGNTSTTVVDDQSYSGLHSLRVNGTLGSCWAGLAAYPVDVSFPMKISIAVQNGNQTLTGCNQFRGGASLRTGCSWTNSSVRLITFLSNGDLCIGVNGYTDTLSGLNLLEWIEIEMIVDLIAEDSIQVKCWANGTYVGEEAGPWTAATMTVDRLEVACWEGSAWYDDVCVSALDESTPIALDIKPGSCPNALNITPFSIGTDAIVTEADNLILEKGGPSAGAMKKAVLPVAILGTESFDVSSVDVMTIMLEGVSVWRSSLEDVSSPFTGDPCGCHEGAPDGYMDLSLKFLRNDIVAALGDVYTGDTIPLNISGTTFGRHSIRRVGLRCHRGWQDAAVSD